jgi:hypothetical protein
LAAPAPNVCIGAFSASSTCAGTSLAVKIRELARRRQAKRQRFAVAMKSRFDERGERAWRGYLRGQTTRAVDEGFDHIDARIAVHLRRRRHADVSIGALLAKFTTSVRFPPAPPAEEW